MKRYLALPTWFMVLIIQPILPKSHPWNNKLFTLDDWAFGRTFLTKMIDLLLWFSFILLIVLNLFML